MIPQIFKNENLYDNIIEKYSKMYNVPFPLIKAIITRESNFNPKSYRFESHRNDASYGLIQILYQTAKGLGYTGTPEGLYDVDTNVKYGTLYLSALLKHYKNLPDVIASYNMGYPRKAKDTTSLIKSIYGTPQPNWIYANQPYVDYVLAYYCYYSAIKNKNYSLVWEIRSMILNKKHGEVWKKYKDKISENLRASLIKWWIALPIGTIVYFLFKRR